MGRHRNTLMRAALSALHYSGTDSLMAPLTRGVGAIFTLHHVRPGGRPEFDPNGLLRVTPEFLDAVIQLVLDRGFEVIGLDEVHARLTEGVSDRPFACFTFDDGYKDNYEFAYPIFRRRGLPFAVYITTDFADGRGNLWWLALEQVVRAVAVIDVKMDGGFRHFVCATPAEKAVAFEQVYSWLRRIDENDARRVVADLARIHDVDVEGLCKTLAMDWDEVRRLAQDPLVTIGAHTRRHYALARLSVAEARLEMEESLRRIETELGRACRHFSFPYGDESSAGPRDFALARELGFKTAVTTRKELLHSHHVRQLTGLPRISLNGDFQRARYVKVMLSGAPFAVWNVARMAMPRLAAGF